MNAATFNANPLTYGSPSLALAQSGSLTGQSYTPVPRVREPFGGLGAGSGAHFQSVNMS